MRIFITAILVLLNFILQTTLLPYAAIRGVVPNTALILVVSYGLLRGENEGCIVGFCNGLLIDIFFGVSFGFYTLLFFLAGLWAGRGQKDFYRENYLLPIISCALATIVYEIVLFVTGFILRGETNLIYFLLHILIPEVVYTAIVTIPMYRILFGINEWLELKEKYKYRLF